MGLLKGNEGWHTDSSYMPVSAKASMLSAHVVPRMGGTTEWADMRAAYDALSDEMKAQELALKTWNVLGCAGFARVDLMYGEELTVLEANAIPGLTDTSLLPLHGRSCSASG